MTSFAGWLSYTKNSGMGNFRKEQRFIFFPDDTQLDKLHIFLPNSKKMFDFKLSLVLASLHCLFLLAYDSAAIEMYVKPYSIV